MTVIEKFSRNLELDDRGVWAAKKQSGISYPDEGNALIFPAEDKLFWFQHRNKCITTLVQSITPDGEVFDIGGGNGVVSKALIDTGIETVLVEPGKEGVKNARGRGIPTIIHATLGDAEFRPGSLPAVGLFDVLEHIEDDRGMLDEIGRLLQEGGKLYISVPAYNWLWSHEDDYAGHFRRYTLKGLRSLLKETDFTVEYASYVFSFLPPLSFLIRSLPYRMKLDKWLRIDREKAVQMDLGVFGKMVELILKPEIAAIRWGIPLPMGGSCLVAASKVN